MKSRKWWGIPSALAAAICLFSGPVLAQDDDEGGPVTQGDDAVYISVTKVQFEAGERERGMEIISEYFAPAGEAAGTPPPMLSIHYQTGEWDAEWVWVMEGGMADLEWYRSPDDMKWWAALVELTGSQEAAEEIMDEYLDTLERSITEVGHYHTGEESD